MTGENDENNGRDSYWDRILKALNELGPVHPFEFGPKTVPLLPRVLARAIAGRQNTQGNPDTGQPGNKKEANNKEESTQSEPDIAQDQDEDVNNDKDGSSGQPEKPPD